MANNHYDRVKQSQKKLDKGKALGRKRQQIKMKKEYGKDHPIFRARNEGTKMKTFWDFRAEQADIIVGIDELSKKTLGRYVKYASKDKADHDTAHDASHTARSAMIKTDSEKFAIHKKGSVGKERADTLRKGRDDTDQHLFNVSNRARHQSGKRGVGINRALKRLTKE